LFHEHSNTIQVFEIPHFEFTPNLRMLHMQSKLDTAFAKYHNDVQEMQAKSDDLMRKNKSLRNKNKGTRPPCRVLVDGSLR
jgi:hypothetical protein